MGIEQAQAWWRTGCGMCQQNKDGRKKRGGRGVQQKKHSACGEDFEDSSGVLCDVF